MEAYQVWIVILLCVSVSVLLVPAAVWCVRRLMKKPLGDSNQRATVSRMLVFSACLIVAIWCLRYAVGYFSIMTRPTEGVNLNWFEEVFNSMVHTLQSFSMDEDYTTYILNGRIMMASLFGTESLWIGVYGAYASILNVTAIIAGGAILFELLASIFPAVRLHLSFLAFWKEKYFFSELNPASLALAKSICALEIFQLTRPVIIFTDVYIDDETEKGSELHREAKQLGAICVRDDLAHVKKNRRGNRTFFLIDQLDSGNLQTLVDLSNAGNCEYLKKAEVYLFTNDDAYVQVEKNVRDKLPFEEADLPTFIPVQSYRNLITNLLTDIPLFEPLVGKERDTDGNQQLTVTILGQGQIGTEMFLNTYWMGQILNCDLKINVLSQETEEAFWGKIDYLNPEIKATTTEEDPILQVNRKGEKAKVYCRVEYVQCDVQSSRFISCLNSKNGHFLDTDYFLVSLGSDAANISAANILKSHIGEHHIHIQKPAKTVIAYVVYDNELAETLNQKKYFSFVDEKADIYMKAIGNLQEVYGVRNVFMKEYKAYAQQAHESYMKLQNRKVRADDHRDRMKDDYSFWANRARVMHVIYKAYSMGLIQNSLFDHPDKPEAHRKEMELALADYQKIASGKVTFETAEQACEHVKLLHKMAWLEHRRWNAFMRIKGFRRAADYKKYVVPGVKGSHKQMELKLHPCLVECDQKGIRAAVSPEGIVEETSRFMCKDVDNFDLLDELSYYLHEKKITDCDLKEYDYLISGVKE